MEKKNCKHIIICNSEMKFYVKPRVGNGWYLCPNCNKEEYQYHFSTKNKMYEINSQKIFENIISQLDYCEEKKLVLQDLIEKLKSI